MRPWQSQRPVAMARVRRRLEHWRHTRPYLRAPIPNSLWADAVALARQHGLYETARALPIHYGALKQHLQAADRRGVADGRSRFVELKPMPSITCDDCLIEVNGPRSTVRLHLHGVELPGLARLSRAIAGGDGGSKSRPRCESLWPSMPRIFEKASTASRASAARCSRPIPSAGRCSCFGIAAAARSNVWSTIPRDFGWRKNGSRGGVFGGGRRAVRRRRRWRRINSSG
jgi:hypothetical protein